MTHQVVLVTGDASRAYRLRTMVDEVDELELGEIVDTTAGVLEVLGRRECHVLVVDAEAGPLPALDLVRDVQGRLPYVGILVLTTAADVQQLEAAVDAGSRGLLDLQESFDEVRRRLVGAGDWSVNVRGAQGLQGGMDGVGCHLVTLVGSKGGVGTTTLAVHTARSVRATLPREARVCLVDLDVSKADVPAYLTVVPRRDLADLAGVGDTVTAQAVSDVVFPHASGVDLLCSPAEPERAEQVDAGLVRSLLLTLRQSYDVVVLDAGSAVTDVLVTALELSDEVLVVATPDVPSLRGVKRLTDACDRLSVRAPEEMRLLLNRTSAQDGLQARSIARMTALPLAAATVPAGYRRLEDAGNLRDPARLQDKAMLSAIGSVTAQVLSTWSRNPGSSGDAPVTADAAAPAQRGGRLGRRRQPRLAPDSGVVTVEFMALVPLVVLLLAGCLQAVAYGAASYQASRAAGAAAHALAVGEDADGVRVVVDRTVSGAFDGDLQVGGAQRDGGTVQVAVTVTVPRVVPGPFAGSLRVTRTGGAVAEPPSGRP